MVLRQKCFIANLDSEKGRWTAGAVTARFARRFAAHAATLAYQVPDGLPGVSGGGSANVSRTGPIIVLDMRFCSRASIPVSRLPVFAPSRTD